MYDCNLVLVRGRRKVSLVHTVHTCAKFPWWLAYYYLATLKLRLSFCLPVERLHYLVILAVGYIQLVFKSKTISLWWKLSALLCSRQLVNFKGWTLVACCSFSWNGNMHGQFLQVKSWIPSLFSHHCLHRMWSMEGIFYTGEVGLPCRGC